MKLTRQGYNSFSLEGLTQGKLLAIYNALEKNAYRTSVAEDIYCYLKNCNVIADNPDDVNAIKTRE